MNWDDKGFLLSKIKYSENSVIAEFFTYGHGKSTGIIFGASSKKHISETKALVDSIWRNSS